MEMEARNREEAGLDKVEECWRTWNDGVVLLSTFSLNEKIYRHRSLWEEPGNDQVE
jgi:hypothetical protein